MRIKEEEESVTLTPHTLLLSDPVITERNKRGTEDTGIKERTHSFIPLKPFTFLSPYYFGEMVGDIFNGNAIAFPLNIFHVINSARQMTLGR